MIDMFIFNARFGIKPYYILYILLSIIVYWIGYSGFIHPGLFSISSKYKKYEQQKLRLPEHKINHYCNIMKKAMENEKLFLKPELNLFELADYLNLHPKNLSVVLNTGFKKNFYEFVNSYRIEEVKRQLLDPTFRGRTILEIAFSAGFNSKSTFNDFFKKTVKMTPKEFRKSNFN
jgi:AraC-like DNA-binding protein